MNFTVKLVVVLLVTLDAFQSCFLLEATQTLIGRRVAFIGAIEAMIC